MTPQQKSVLLIFAAVVFFYIYAQLLCYLISLWSGWRFLALRFRYDTQFAGTQYKWQSARMRYGANYNNALIMGADAGGLYLAAVWLLPQHPPLYIPWNEIELVGRRTVWKWEWTTYALGSEEKLPFTIKSELAEKLLRDAGANVATAKNKKN